MPTLNECISLKLDPGNQLDSTAFKSICQGKMKVWINAWKGARCWPRASVKGPWSLSWRTKGSVSPNRLSSSRCCRAECPHLCVFWILTQHWNGVPITPSQKQLNLFYFTVYCGGVHTEAMRCIQTPPIDGSQLSLAAVCRHARGERHQTGIIGSPQHMWTKYAALCKM